MFCISLLLLQNYIFLIFTKPHFWLMPCPPPATTTLSSSPNVGVSPACTAAATSIVPGLPLSLHPPLPQADLMMQYRRMEQPMGPPSQVPPSPSQHPAAPMPAGTGPLASPTVPLWNSSKYLQDLIMWSANDEAGDSWVGEGSEWGGGGGVDLKGWVCDGAWR